MRRRVTYRPSKAQSILGGVVGAIFVLLGLVMVIPMAGPFGLLWTAVAAAIAATNFYHAFGKGYIGPNIEISDEGELPAAAESPEDRLKSFNPSTTSGLLRRRSMRRSGRRS